jgi:hypothetical protein
MSGQRSRSPGGKDGRHPPARDNDRANAYRHLDLACQVAEKVGDGRDDTAPNSGPSTVTVYAVSVAVDLGDARHVLDQAY